MPTIQEVLSDALAEVVSPLVAKTILSTLPPEVGTQVGGLDLVATQGLVHQVETGLRLFGAVVPVGFAPQLRWRCLGTSTPPPVVVDLPILSHEDVYLAVRHCHRLCRYFLLEEERNALAAVAYDLANALRVEGAQGDLRLDLTEDLEGFLMVFSASVVPAEIADPTVVPVRPRTPGGTEVTLLRMRDYLDSLDVVSPAGGGSRIRGAKRFRGDHDTTDEARNHGRRA